MGEGSDVVLVQVEGKALAPDPNAVASLDALAHDLGLGDAN
jgi:hypothetical protein